MQDIIIVGAGGCGREVYEMAKEAFSPTEYRFKGFLSDDLHVLDGLKVDIPVIDTISGYEIQPEDRFLMAIGDPAGKRRIAVALKTRGAQFLTLIHPTAKVFDGAVLGEGVVLYPFTFISVNVVVGDFCLLNIYSGCGHDATVGAYSVVCPHASVLGYASLGEETFLATQAVVGPKVKLGARTKVSANSSALRSAPDDSFICGVPGKIL